MLAPGSVVSVIGFGSSNGPGQSPVDVVCPPTLFDSAQKRDSIANCIGGLHRRTPAEGDDTDHVAALQQAQTFFQANGPQKKVIFLLTDGKLNVANSQFWGDTPQRRNAAASAKLTEVLGQLGGAGVQVWPFGFGSVDQSALRGFAQGKSCTPAARDPHEQTTPTSADLIKAVSEALSSASCVKYESPATGRVPQGGATDLTVTIPTVASDASILVYKRDPRIQVEYWAPGATTPVSATGRSAGGSHFEFVGQTTETESLRITDPEPGEWRVHLSSGDVPTQDVAATVVYQAAVKTYLNVNPPQPSPGQTVAVEMQVWARGRAITDANTLQDLTFVTAVSGAGAPAQDLPLVDDDHDGTFTGQYKVPDKAAGELTFTGKVSGIGIGGDTRVFPARIRSSPATVQAQILFNTNEAAVTPGASVSGSVAVANDSGKATRLRLEVVEPTQGTTLTVDPGIVQAAPGQSTMPFTLHFGAGSPLGGNGAKLRLVDDENPQIVVAERLYAVTIAPAPGLVQKYFWLLVGLAALLVMALALLYFRLRARRDACSVRGLKVRLLHRDDPRPELEPRVPGSRRFRFVVRTDFMGPQLHEPEPGDASFFEIRRAGQTIELVAPGAAAVRLLPSQRQEIGPDLAIVILDERGSATGPVPSVPVTGIGYDPFGGAAPGLSTGVPTETMFDTSPTAEPSPPLAPNPFAAAVSGTGDGDGAFPAHDDPFGEDSVRGEPSADAHRRDSAPLDPYNPFS
ncbi:hypothetical protein AMK34_21930 [Amycolatopsis sp. CB00013]|nr:hypothetical protein AMK34_21930 [Amycolatopsis sp. CB00013]